MSEWNIDTRMALALYERSCPSGELDYIAIDTALKDLEIPMFKRRLMRQILPAIHREIKTQSKQQTES